LAQTCTKSFVGCGLAPDPIGGAYSDPQTLAIFRGPTSIREGGKGGRSERKGWEEGKGRGEKRRGRMKGKKRSKTKGLWPAHFSDASAAYGSLSS